FHGSAHRILRLLDQRGISSSQLGFRLSLAYAGQRLRPVPLADPMVRIHGCFRWNALDPGREYAGLPRPVRVPGTEQGTGEGNPTGVIAQTLSSAGADGAGAHRGFTGNLCNLR